MTTNRFTSVPTQLGPTLPVFPLSGVLLLPRGQLPLNIFEPRYLAMVDDALGSDRLIGMVQPVDPASREAAPAIYDTGCAGRIASFEETDDGRYLITLAGVSRFRIAEELPRQRGYRRVRPDWHPFASDLAAGEDGVLDRARLGAALTSYFRRHGISASWEAIEDAPDERLITCLSMICPFSPSEKQALLEAPSLTERGQLMMTMLEMAVLDGCPRPGACH